jgi:tyrosyl-tRNA synthetase
MGSETIAALVLQTGLVHSLSAARRAIQSGAISIDGHRITDPHGVVILDDRNELLIVEAKD